MRWILGALLFAAAALSALVALLYGAIRSIEDNDLFTEWESWDLLDKET